MDRYIWNIVFMELRWQVVTIHMRRLQEICSVTEVGNHWRIQGAPGTHAPGYKFFHFHAVFGKKIGSHTHFGTGCYLLVAHSSNLTTHWLPLSQLIVTSERLLKSNHSSGGSRISPRRRRQLPGAPTYNFCQILPKTAWNLKNLDPRGAHVPRAPLRSAAA